MNESTAKQKQDHMENKLMVPKGGSGGGINRI